MKKSNIIESLEWRYATKQFDNTKKVSDADMNEILEAGRLAPSSFGLQPWKFIAITDTKLREQLKAATWSQPQVCDASHLVVLAVRTDVNAEYVKDYVKKIAEVRKVPVESLKEYEDMMLGAVEGGSKNAQSVIEWSTRQVYIALGFMLETAALKKIDACPMEGFEPDKYDEILGLKKQNLHAVVLMPVGHRAADDPALQKAKVRFDLNDVVIRR